MHAVTGKHLCAMKSSQSTRVPSPRPCLGHGLQALEQVISASAHGPDADCAQVLPFILRRTKEAVLHDLPPKIVQDVLCTAGALQAQLLQLFQQSPAAADMASAVRQAAAAEAGQKPAHIFQVDTPAHLKKCFQSLGVGWQPCNSTACLVWPVHQC